MIDVRLTGEEKRVLEAMQKQSPSFVIRGHCMCLLLSNSGHSITQVSKLLGFHRHTVERLIDKWDSAVDDKFSVLQSAKGQGAKVKLEPVADILPELIEQHHRNLKPILEILEKEHSIKVCKLTLLNFLKGTGL